MRGVHEKGRKTGQVTKSGKKGTPWSEVWKEEMGRCTGEGAGFADQEEDISEPAATDGEEQEERRQGDDDPNDIAKQLESGGAHELKLRRLRCSPVTVIYGHAGESFQLDRLASS